MLSGVVVTPQFELVPNVSVKVTGANGTAATVTDGEGRFSIIVSNEALTVTFSGKNIPAVNRVFFPTDRTNDIQVGIKYLVPPLTESVTIQAESLTPQLEFRNESVYKNTLFSRDDQLVQSLNAGINAGQHEGGGKSLEIRRYGFNLDHGGVNGGVKILVDNVQQNQGTQGHGQGYLGGLKSLTPELVQDVSIINGPFSAAYGDFSGLGVVHIKLRESLPDVFTARLQGGSFNTVRGFFAYSPSRKKIDSYFAYEPSYTDGPFDNPLKYRRDNFTSNVTYKLSEHRAVGFRTNFGRNEFTSSGQIPLDLVSSGDLSRFGFIDPENGGKVQLGTGAVYFRNEFASGSTFKADGFIARSLFDLYSNFTFFALDPVFGDEIQQHDSRLQEGANLQYLHPFVFSGFSSLLTVGANFHANQINAGLYPTVARNPNRKFLAGNLDNPDVLLTSAHADVNNYAAYAENEIAFFNGRLRVATGLRFDRFTFDVNGFELSDARRDLSGRESAQKFQPKLSVAVSPFGTFPLTLYANYGRGISTQDARGIIRAPDSPKISTTDFYQTGGSYNSSRFSAVLSGFLLDRSNEQVYIPDDGSIELAGPTRSYGLESRASVKIARGLSFNAGFTHVLKAFYRGQFSADGGRLIVDSSPHLTANAGLVFADLRGFNASLNWRHISSYRLDGDDRAIRAAGNDVVDLAVTKRLKKWLDVNFAVDNLLNKNYYETQNYFESRACQTCGLVTRIHATPGYPFTASAGLTFHFGAEK